MMTLLVMYGSRACEHDVSIITAVQAMDNLDKAKYNVVPVYIDKPGRWLTGDALRAMDFYTPCDEQKVPPALAAARSWSRKRRACSAATRCCASPIARCWPSTA